MPIPRSSADYVDACFKLLSRLSRHLDAVERGVAGSGDDLAAVLRILIDPQDKGNRAVQRLADAIGAPLPHVLVSGAPDEAQPGTLVSFGNLPVVPGPLELGLPHAPRYLPFSDWIGTRSLIVPSSERKAASWGGFAALVGNTSGSHMSTVYHDFLATSDLFGSVGLSLQTYFLRQVGWQVERVLAYLLREAGRPLLPRARALDFWPRMLVWGWFRETPGVGAELALAINVTSDGGGPLEVMRYDWRGRTHHIWHDGGTGVRSVTDDPV